MCRKSNDLIMQRDLGRGPQPSRPIIDTVLSSRHRNMKELRLISSGRSELRVLFDFDPERSAIMLIEGDKAGNRTLVQKEHSIGRRYF